MSSCASQASTSIIRTMELIPSPAPVLPPSSSDPDTAPRLLNGGSGGSGGGGRAIDRHNPIVTDGKRSLSSSITTSASTLLHSSFNDPTSNPVVPPKHHHQSDPNKKPADYKKTREQKSGSSITTLFSFHRGGRRFLHPNQSILQAVVSKKASKESRLLGNGRCGVGKPGVDYISPSESSRYLLHNNENSNDMGSADESLSTKPGNTTDKEAVVVGHRSSTTIEPRPSSCSSDNLSVPSKSLPAAAAAASSQPSHHPDYNHNGSQVVVLRVSLHCKCKGCEAKLRKHIHKMQGVTSFTIDFILKKVTVVGDVTPSGVLASISKVKNCQLWDFAPPPPISPYIEVL